MTSTASASTSWMPVADAERHPVAIGSSLGRALKARKGSAAPTRSKLPEREFYSFRYNFKPESVDATKPGTIEVKKGRDTTSVAVERASAQTGEGGHSFVGQEQPAKEWDCVLIYDEDMGTFTLEKLDSYMNLTYDRKTPHAPRHPGSPLPAAPARVAASASGSSTAASSQPHTPTQPHSRPVPTKSSAASEVEDFLQAAMPKKSEDRLPARPTTQGSNRPTPRQLSAEDRARLALRREEEEESEGEIHEDVTPQTLARDMVPAVKAPPPPRPSQGRAQSSSVAKPASKPRQSQAPPSVTAPPAPPPKAKPAPASAAGQKRARADVEDGAPQAGRATQPAKRARPSPPPPARQKEKEAAPFSLALPSSSHAATLPKEPPPPLSFPGSSTGAVALPSMPAAQVDSDEEEDWDEVQPTASPAAAPAAAATAPPPPPLPVRRIEMEEIVPTSEHPALPDADEDDEDMEEMEIDMNAFEAEMNNHLGGDVDMDADAEADADADGDADADADAEGEEEEEDFLAAAVSPVADRPSAGGYGTSGNVGEWGDDDDYSSSDESDDD